MRLWTEYEGETIDGAFPLNRLLLPQGRSAFFSTANSKGDPAVMRLIECHFDQDEIIARWRCVEALNHPNLLRLERYGQTELDGGPAVYALFEKTDANLADVLAQGRLNVKDAAQLAFSVAAALEVLHTHGFVHEHVEPENIYAVGDVVKLRSDCVRDTPEGQDGLKARQHDVHDLAVVLLQALAQRQTIEADRPPALPPPFDSIVQNGMNGTWGLKEIRAAVEAMVRSAPVPIKAAPAKPAATVPVATPRETTPPAGGTAKPGAQPAPAGPVAVPPVAAAPAAQPAPQFSGARRRTSSWNDNVVPSSIHQELGRGRPDEVFTVGSGLWATLKWNLKSRLEPELRSRLGLNQEFGQRSRWLGVAAMVVIMAVFSAFFFAHLWSGTRNKTSSAAATAASAPLAIIARTAPAKGQAAGSSLAAASVQPQMALTAPAAGTRMQWRVITYTYNRQDEARKKADAIAQKHPELQPQVFTPTGHRPYLVTVGGVMSRDQAIAFARKIRGRGLPRDTYAQNYSGKSR